MAVSEINSTLGLVSVHRAVGFWRLFHSALGKKILMALSGLVLFGFIIAHMLGNLQVFLGPDALNAYGDFLKSTPELLWPLRIVMLIAVPVHLWAATSLTLANRAARPVGYRQDQVDGASYASRTMAWGGVIVLTFLIYHLLHFTLGVTDPAQFALHDRHGRHDVYAMVVLGFQNPLVALSYVVAVAVLGVHLSHGFASMFRSLGLFSKSWRPVQEKLSVTLAVLIFVGQAIVPLAVLLGLVTLRGH